MPDANDAVFISRELAEETRDLVNSWKRGSLTGRKNRRDPTGSSYMPPLRGILLEDLPDGGTADCATTILFKDSTIQEVVILGDASAGTFTLGFKGKTTTALAWNVSAADMQAALEKLETIGPNNVTVSLGKGDYTNSDNPDADPRTEFPGLWVVSFIGVFAGRTDTPLLTVTSSVTGASVTLMVIESTQWGDTGKVATVRAVVPVGTPTPMRAGAVIVAIAFPGIGYGVICCEPRQFGSPY